LLGEFSTIQSQRVLAREAHVVAGVGGAAGMAVVVRFALMSAHLGEVVYGLRLKGACDEGQQLLHCPMLVYARERV
jgi:hypothetical protein